MLEQVIFTTLEHDCLARSVESYGFLLPMTVPATATQMLDTWYFIFFLIVDF